MKKGLYISLDHTIDDLSFNALASAYDGIRKKIISQFLCMKNNGFDMDMLCPYANRNHRIRAIVRRLPFSGLIPYGKDYIAKAKDYDFIYIRSPWFMDGDTPRFLKKMKKSNPSIKIVLEIPTYTTNTGEINKWHYIPLAIKNRLSMSKMLKLIDRIFTFSKEENICGVKVLNSFNAIDSSLVTKINHENAGNNTIVLIACSSMAFWHGYDRAIEGIAEYYSKNNRTYDIELYLVGDGEEKKNLEALSVKRGVNKHVHFLGYLSGKDLDRIYNLADIALDSLGRHRSGIFYNSSLKGKEYCAKGLPIVSGVETELDCDKDYRYYLRIPSDDTPLDISVLISFYERIYNSTKSRNDIIDEISLYAAEHFSYSKSLKPVFDYLNEGK